jgi:hypothetical protein
MSQWPIWPPRARNRQGRERVVARSSRFWNTGTKLSKVSRTSRHSKKVRSSEERYSHSYGPYKILQFLDTERIPTEYSIESDNENGSSEPEPEPGLEAEPEPEPEPELEPVEILSHHEEEPPYIIEETSGPDQAATPDDQWNFSVPVPVPKKKKKASKKMHRSVEVLAE